jgi:hypothetical protein
VTFTAAHESFLSFASSSAPFSSDFTFTDPATPHSVAHLQYHVVAQSANAILHDEKLKAIFLSFSSLSSTLLTLWSHLSYFLDLLVLSPSPCNKVPLHRPSPERIKSRQTAVRPQRSGLEVRRQCPCSRTRLTALWHCQTRFS